MYNSETEPILAKTPKPELSSLQFEQMQTVKLKIQIILFHYLEQKLFGSDAEAKRKFSNWLIKHEDLMEKVSDSGEEIIRNLDNDRDFVASEVADDILNKILQDDKLKQELEAVKPGVDLSDFNYFKTEELLKNKRFGA